MLAAKVLQWKKRTGTKTRAAKSDQVVPTSDTATTILMRTLTGTQAMMALFLVRILKLDELPDFSLKLVRRAFMYSEHNNVKFNAPDQ